MADQHFRVVASTAFSRNQDAIMKRATIPMIFGQTALDRIRGPAMRHTACIWRADRGARSCFVMKWLPEPMRRSLFLLALVPLLAGLIAPLSARAQAGYWIPSKDAVWQLQWSNAEIVAPVIGAIDIAILPMYSTDPNNKTNPNALQDQIVDLHKQKIKVICSLPAGVVNIVSDPDKSSFTQRMWGKGASYWQDQRWLDVRNTGVRKLVEARIVYAISIGCDAIEVQWVDAYIQDTGLPITYGDQLAFNRWLATTAHQHGIAIGLRNDYDQIADLEDWFDFSVADNCMGTAECELVSPFVESGKPVFNVEYTSTQDEIHICNASAYFEFNTIIKSYGVDASWQKCN